MDNLSRYELFLRNRITQLREQRSASEHRMSLDLDKSGSYTRSITSGATLPSVKESVQYHSIFRGQPTLRMVDLLDPASELTDSPL